MKLFLSKNSRSAYFTDHYANDFFFVHLSEFKWILSSFKLHRTTSIIGHSLSIFNSVKLICVRKLNKFQNQRNIEQSVEGFVWRIDTVVFTVKWPCNSTNSPLSFGESLINIGCHQMVFDRIFRMLLLDTGCRNATVTTKTFICFDRPMIRRNLRSFIILRTLIHLKTDVFHIWIKNWKSARASSIFVLLNLPSKLSTANLKFNWSINKKHNTLRTYTTLQRKGAKIEVKLQMMGKHDSVKF